MTREDIIKKAFVIVLPFSDHNSNDSKNDYTEFLNSHRGFKIESIDKKYKYINDIYNVHHMTTWWHYNIFLPMINNYLDFGYSLNDFHIISNRKDIGDYSYALPKIQTSYDIECVHKEWTDKENGRYMYYFIDKDDVNSNEITNVSKIFDDDFYGPNGDTKTNYHRLFLFPHEPCCLNNKNAKNDRNLLIISDSHMIPIIPILSYYFKSVTAIDNRYESISCYDAFLKEKDFSDILFIMWENRPLKYYIDNLN